MIYLIVYAVGFVLLSPLYHAAAQIADENTGVGVDAFGLSIVCLCLWPLSMPAFAVYAFASHYSKKILAMRARANAREAAEKLEREREEKSVTNGSYRGGES